ncbi:MurR/RpiR family transcriptional regulator [Clostridium intestinale]|jgi:DNA-binding MurR/RpiR family transcriptional regulator|uniref:MurR/RpiR family transcriptional regulator n=1 Tax=Clostridium intestinale TaxID=36845 RepID=UPI002433F3DD|nr:MurR/RpiR family transcriptional regulator [Clostridium intestinale]
MIFDPKKVKTLNDLEMVVYQYVVDNLEEVSKMTIRELSNVCHVSPSSILRCCNKLGFSGYAEFKYKIKQKVDEYDSQAIEEFFDLGSHIKGFLKDVNKQDYRKVLKPAIDMIIKARHIAFSGIGTSGILGEYGSRYFTNMKMNAYSISDPFYPIPPRGLENTLAIIISVSGETVQMIEKAEDFKRYGAKVLSITNNEESTLARIADYNLSYYMPEVKSKEEKYLNLTTQVPVVTLIELLAHQAYIRMNKEQED